MSESLLNSLLEMGFPQNRAEKALAKTQFQGIPQAMDWLFAHEDDPDIDVPLEAPQGYTLGESTSASSPAEDAQQTSEQTPPSETTPQEQDTAGGDSQDQPMEAKSYKCEDCGKLLKDEDALQFHAAKTEHSNFSESTDEVKPLTEEEKREQLARLQEKLKQKRLEREAHERKEEIQREKNRRHFGKDVTASKEKLQELELKKLAEERKREKMEEKLARQRVKEQIEKDKRDRAAKFGTHAQTTPVSTGPPAAATPPQPVVQSEHKEYTEARIQIRLTNGQALTQTFAAKEPLAAVRLYVEMNRTDSPGNFTLMTSFPRKVFSGEDYEKPLTELGLVPSAVLIVTKAQ